MKLKDQVAVVTGAGRNIGEEIAKLFAAEGAKVAIVDVDKPQGERVVGAIKGSGGEAELFTGSDADWVADIGELAKLGISAVDVRLFGYGPDQSLDATIGNMRRFRDGVLARL